MPRNPIWLVFILERQAVRIRGQDIPLSVTLLTSSLSYLHFVNVVCLYDNTEFMQNNAVTLLKS